jgi:hypothetical protein
MSSIGMRSGIGSSSWDGVSALRLQDTTFSLWYSCRGVTSVSTGKYLPFRGNGSGRPVVWTRRDDPEKLNDHLHRCESPKTRKGDSVSICIPCRTWRVRTHESLWENLDLQPAGTNLTFLSSWFYKSSLSL